MAKIYSKPHSVLGSEKCLILDPREALILPFNVGDWTELRVGFYTSVTTATDDNAPHVTETVNMNSAANCLAWGLKDSGPSLPYTAGSTFWGQVYGNITGSSDPRTLSAASQNIGFNAGAYALNGTTLLTNGGGTTTGFYITGVNGGADTAYCWFTMYKFVINNRGAANQTVNVHYASGGSPSSTPTVTQTRSNIMSFNTSATGPIAWNDGTSARPIPDAVYLRLPFVNNRLRIHALVIERMA